MHSPHPSWYGILAMVLATGFFIVSDSMMKVVAQDLAPFQVLFMRSLFGFAFAVVLVTALGQWTAWRGALHWRSVARGIGESASTFLYMAALVNTPIADVIAIGQTAPLLVLVALAVFFRERIGGRRLILVCAGFLGALLVAQPTGAGLSPSALFAFLTAVVVAARDLIARGIPAATPAFVVLLATTFLLAASTGIATAGWEEWVPPSAGQWLVMLVSGLIVTLGQLAIFLSYRWAPAAMVAPYYYSFTVWAVAAGFAVWREIPNLLALAGMTMIVASGLGLLFLRQSAMKPEKAAGQRPA